MTEDVLQSKMVLAFRQKYQFKNADNFAIIFAVPNGGRRSAREGMLLKRTGVMAGVTDLICIHSNGVEFIEVKTRTGRLSKVQSRFKTMLEMVGMGDRWHLVMSVEELMDKAESFIIDN